LWLVACGLWLVACGLWLVACGLFYHTIKVSYCVGGGIEKGYNKRIGICSKNFRTA
jgi:hypothetical protein